METCENWVGKMCVRERESDYGNNLYKIVQFGFLAMVGLIATTGIFELFSDSENVNR